MTWIFFAIIGLLFFWGINMIFFGRGRVRRRAPNILNQEGWPKEENRGGARPNDEE